MNKNKLLKIMTATTMASSAIAAVAPVQTEAATSSVDKAISKAKNQIAKAYNIYYKAVDEGVLPNTSKIQKETKLARDYYNAAVKQIAKNGGSKSQKAAYLKQLDTKKKYLTRAEKYVAAVKINIGAEKAAFQTAVKGGTPSKVLTAKVALDKRIAEFEGAVAKIYGQGTRKLLLKKYAEPARNLSTTVDDEIAVYKAYKQIEQNNLIQTDLVKAEKLITDVEDKVAKLNEKDTTLAKNLVQIANKDFIAYAKASGFVTSQKEVDAVIANAKDGDQVEIKLLALENITIETTKALTITLTGNIKGKDVTINAPNTHVTNDANNSDVVTIKDVSNNSFEQDGTYELLVFEDQNGGRLINGTPNPLNITLGNGAKPTLKGKFGVIKANGSANVILESGTVVNTVEATGLVYVTPREGATIEGKEGQGDVIITQPSSGGGGGGSVDRTPPILSNVNHNVTIDGETINLEVSATSNEAGYFYLVPKGTYASVTDLQNAASQNGSKVTAIAGQPTTLNVSGVVADTYVVYAVDHANNISVVSKYIPAKPVTKDVTNADLNLIPFYVMSSNDNVAKAALNITGGVTITAVSAGTATVTVRDGNHEATIDVTVTENEGVLQIDTVVKKADTSNTATFTAAAYDAGTNTLTISGLSNIEANSTFNLNKLTYTAGPLLGMYSLNGTYASVDSSAAVDTAGEYFYDETTSTLTVILNDADAQAIEGLPDFNGVFPDILIAGPEWNVDESGNPAMVIPPNIANVTVIPEQIVTKDVTNGDLNLLPINVMSSNDNVAKAALSSTGVTITAVSAGTATVTVRDGSNHEATIEVTVTENQGVLQIDTVVKKADTSNTATFTAAAYDAGTNTLTISGLANIEEDSSFDLTKLTYSDSVIPSVPYSLAGTYTLTDSYEAVDTAGEYFYDASANTLTVKLADNDAQAVEVLPGFGGEITDNVTAAEGWNTDMANNKAALISNVNVTVTPEQN